MVDSLTWSLLHAKFHPHRCSGGVWISQTVTFAGFFKILEYKRPAETHSSRDFFEKSLWEASRSKACLNLGEPAVERGDSLKGSEVSPKFSVPLTAKLYVESQNVLVV